jgi:ATP-dependent protease HslVU (ClpYQ) peptidase subunit
MSVVAVRIIPNGFEMCSDSIIGMGSTQLRGENEKFSKLFEVKNIVVGCAGYADEASLLQLFLDTHNFADSNEKSILEFLNEFSDWKKNKTDDGKLRNSYLLGFDGKVFHIQGWLINQVLTYSAIGAGMDYALSALYLGHSAEKAVETAIELSIYCETPILKIIKINKDK